MSRSHFFYLNYPIFSSPKLALQFFGPYLLRALIVAFLTLLALEPLQRLLFCVLSGRFSHLGLPLLWDLVSRLRDVETVIPFLCHALATALVGSVLRFCGLLANGPRSAELLLATCFPSRIHHLCLLSERSLVNLNVNVVLFLMISGDSYGKNFSLRLLEY